MTLAGWMQLAALVAAVVASTRLLGPYLAQVYGNERRAPGDRIFLPVERAIYRACRIDPDREQRWTVYAYSLLAFSAVSGLLLYGMSMVYGATGSLDLGNRRRQVDGSLGSLL